MANKIQIKRTSTSGLLPNTTNSSNSSYIDAGELAINLTDKKLLSSNGSVTFEVGANLTNLSVGSITANGTLGSAGQGLVSNGSAVYWSNNPGYTGSQGYTGSTGPTPESTTYTAQSIALTNGVYVSGSVTDVQSFNDGNQYIITDGTASGPAWIIDVGFTGITSFNQVDLNIQYTQSSGHTI